MELQNKYQIDKNNVTYRVIDEEAVILNLENGYYYSLNPVGTEIWKGLENNKSLAEILETLKKDYLIHEKEIQKDLLRLVKDLQKEKIIQPC